MLRCGGRRVGVGRLRGEVGREREGEVDGGFWCFGNRLLEGVFYGFFDLRVSGVWFFGICSSRLQSACL